MSNLWIDKNDVEAGVESLGYFSRKVGKVGVAACYERSNMAQDDFVAAMQVFSGLGKAENWGNLEGIEEFAAEVRNHTRGNLQESALAALAFSQVGGQRTTEQLVEDFQQLMSADSKTAADSEAVQLLEDLLGEEALYGEGKGEGDDGGSTGEGTGRGIGGEECQRLDNLEATYRLAGNLEGRGVTDFMNLLGRAVEIVDGAVDEHILGSGQDSALTYGSNAARALPTELANSATFALKFAEGTLLQTEQQETVPHGRGPIIMVVDQSGSMGGAPANWAIAMSFAALRMAQLQKRPYHCVQFASGENSPRLVLSLEDASGATACDYLAVATQWIGGGTHLEPALNAALDIVEDNGYEGADIVCVSDGDWERFEHTPYRGGGFTDQAVAIAKRLELLNAGLLTLNYKKGEHDTELTPFASPTQAVNRVCTKVLAESGSKFHLRGGDYQVTQKTEGAAIEEVVRQVLADNDQGGTR